jgi:general secretion pathway protein M
VTPSSASSLLPVRRQIIAGSIYFAIVAALLASSLWFLSDLMARSEAVANAEKRLDQLAKRGQWRQDAAASAAGMAGSPFLDGPTITIAGAALEQRVSEAIGKAGGAITSSQVEFDGPDAKNGFVDLMTSAEVNQSALQAILYDIEAGLPYLFIEKLSLQSPEDFGEPETGRMRMTIAVAGQWRAGK